MKATRLGGAPANPAAFAQGQTATNNSGTSFFSKLTWVHYAGAAVAGVFLIGLLIFVPLVLFGISKATNEIKAADKSVPVEVKDQKPEVVTMPTQAPAVAEQNQSQQQQEPVSLTPIAPEESVTLEQKPAEKSAGNPAVKQDKSAQRDTVAQKPAAPPPGKKAAPPAQDKPKSAPKKSLDDVLSGN